MSNRLGGDNLDPIEVMPIRVRIASALRNALLAGEYKSGEELSLTEVASQFGVSRTPVREAFQALAAEGFLKLRMNKGAIVVGISEKMIREHYEMRQLLEGEAVARVARIRPDISHLLALQAEAELHTEDLGADEYRRYNQLIHTTLWELADNSKLYSYLSGLWNGPSVGKFVPTREHQQKSILEHRIILNYIQNGDAEGGRHAMEKHVLQGLSNMLLTGSSPK